MTNPDAEDKAATSAFLTVSANLIGPGDEAAELKLGSEKVVNAKKPWMPTNVVKNYKQFYFKVIRANNLPLMDTFGTIDAFIKYQMNSKSKVKTKVVKMKDNLVIWNQEILIPIELPTSKDHINFELFDSDALSNEMVANLHFSIKDILEKVGQDPKVRKYHLQWFNLYGCNTSVRNKISVM
jgi:hypothetical protein